MGPAHEIDVMLLTEFLDHVLSKNKRDPSFVLTPSGDIVWIGPQKVAEYSLIRHILWPLDLIDLREVVNVRR